MACPRQIARAISSLEALPAEILEDMFVASNNFMLPLCSRMLLSKLTGPLLHRRVTINIMLEADAHAMSNALKRRFFNLAVLEGAVRLLRLDDATDPSFTHLQLSHLFTRYNPVKLCPRLLHRFMAEPRRSSGGALKPEGFWKIEVLHLLYRHCILARPDKRLRGKAQKGIYSLVKAGRKAEIYRYLEFLARWDIDFYPNWKTFMLAIEGQTCSNPEIVLLLFNFVEPMKISSAKDLKTWIEQRKISDEISRNLLKEESANEEHKYYMGLWLESLFYDIKPDFYIAQYGYSKFFQHSVPGGASVRTVDQ
ncbi:MAG: hypothetical protein M1829_001442 [Trizodia sp. TS-e1964]|nr:MAG: hypothetical protein M1829_001442 [Trizodia sp. TS-e1964]